ncbi:MMPL family transporter [Ornithinimicrobium pratense]|uniref:MMPL family transporter n=1 Tax=Ornithinimicrobium pratense TaxID=2593973 RepID=A0A5J6V8T0_9MICO|nr:MMPL family transporter [Ornithinimicrobium pratense]QFG69392.1 MMPL family transporter [Ornithinimicrobium pratense]
MAILLHKLGRWCAQHRWTVIGIWAAVLVLVSVSAVTFMRPLTNEISIPDSRFEAVLDTLREEIPEASGTTGTVVFTGDAPFTDDQQDAIADVVERWNAMDDVEAVDPFESQQQLDDSQQQIVDGRAELEAGAEELDAGEAELTEAREQLDAGREQLEAGESEIATQAQLLDEGQAELDAQSEQLEGAVAAGLIPPAQAEPARAEIAAAQAQLDAGREQLEAGQAQLAQSREELEAAEQQISEGEAEIVSGREALEQGEVELAAGQRLADLTDGMRVVNEEGTVAMTQVSVTGGEASAIDPDTAREIQAIGESIADTGGVQVDFSGEFSMDLNSIFGPSEAVGLAVAAVVLLVMLGTLLAAGLPILMALVGVGVGVAGSLALSPFFDMQSITPVLALMLGLAVGIDYSLFLINRHREQLRHGMPLRESIALAVGTSGNAVTFAGLTVIIALSALTLTGMPFLGIMGLVAAATVGLSVLVAITLTPALLSLMGLRVLPRKARAAVASGDEAGNAAQDLRQADTGRGWAAGVQRRPWLAILAVVAIVVGLGYPTGQLRLGLPDSSSEPAGSTAYTTYDTIRSEFGAGATGPILAVAELDEPVGDGEVELIGAQADIAEDLAEIDGVLRVLPAGVNENRDVLAFQIQPEGGPTEESTVRLVDDLDATLPALGTDHGASIDITGQTVANIDISEQLGDALPVYLAVVVGLSLILLLLVFRSIWVPLLATVGFLLSIVAAFGAVVAVYQLGHLSFLFGVNEPGPVLSFLPILLIGILFGLAMDYQLFLVSSMREMFVHGKSAKEAVVSGFNLSARVVTAAAIIMISVFAGFIGAHLTMVRPIGLGLAVGVLIDAFLVRMTLTPAVLTLLGEKAWWLPRWLDRVLPNVDVEGVRLEQSLTPAGSGSGSAAQEPEPAGRA